MESLTRRTFTKLSVAAATLAIPAPITRLDSGTREGIQGQDDHLSSEFLLDLTLETGTPHDVGAVGGGGLLIVPITGGTFEGPKIHGTVIGPAADWLVQRPDATRVPDVRLIVQTDDSQLIYVSWRGIAYSPAAGSFYARILPFFQTAAAKYTWLNDVVAVGVYRPTPGKVGYRLYQVL